MDALSDQQLEDFERGFASLDPLIARWCGRRRYQWTRLRDRQVGRRLDQSGAIERFFEFLLWPREDGRYDETFSVHSLVCVGSGAVFDLERVRHIRWVWPRPRLISFSVLTTTIEQLLDETVREMSEWNSDSVARQGRRFDLDAPFRLEEVRGPAPE